MNNSWCPVLERCCNTGSPATQKSPRLGSRSGQDGSGRLQRLSKSLRHELRHRVLVGTVACGRAGLGSSKTPCYDKAQGKDKRLLIQDEVRASVEEQRTSRMIGMQQQGAWTRWEQVVERKVSWTELWKAEPYRIKFLIQAVNDNLPSPSNLFSWGMVESPACPLCLKRGTLEHILSCYSKALGEGRYH